MMVVVVVNYDSVSGHVGHDVQHGWLVEDAEAKVSSIKYSTPWSLCVQYSSLDKVEKLACSEERTVRILR